MNDERVLVLLREIRNAAVIGLFLLVAVVLLLAAIALGVVEVQFA